MSIFRIVPIHGSLTRKVREEMKSPQYGFPAHEELAQDQAPCRSCLNGFQLGSERRLLFTYNPFDGIDPYPLPGPVYIHQETCPEFKPEPDCFPDGLRAFSMVLEGYGRNRWILTRERPPKGDIESTIHHMLENPAVEYIHLRSASAGCYIAHIERVG